MGQSNSMVSLNVKDVIKNKNLKDVYLHNILNAINVINSKLELSYVLKKVVYYASKLTNSDVTSIILTNDSIDDLTIAYSTDLKSNIRFPRAKSIAGQCICTGQIKIVYDVKKNEGFYPGVDKITGTDTKSILSIPLNVNGVTIGCMEFINKHDSVNFNDEDVAVASIISNIAAVSIRNAEAYERMQKENHVLKSQIPSAEVLIGKNRKVKEIFKSINKLKNKNATVLILGESGTGKGILARAIHDISNRRGRPFVTVNCPTFSKLLLESELFGHEKGAFTGAVNQKKGRFELASDGTIFLDEIGDVDKETQTKLLRVLDNKEFERVGGTETLITNALIIAATNVNLKEAMKLNRFREDLFYRLNVIDFELPPLRERREDIPAFAEHFLEKYCNEENKPIPKFNNNSMDILQKYHYPGNIRELESIIRKIVILTEGDVICESDLPAEILLCTHVKNQIDHSAKFTTMPDLEKEAILKALRETSWNISKAARLLDISRDQLRYRLGKYKLNKPKSIIPKLRDDSMHESNMDII